MLSQTNEGEKRMTTTKPMSEKITVQVEQTVAEVSAWPDEVYVKIEARDGNLTPEQARDLAAMLIQAAEDAPHLSWDESVENIIDDRG
jgi:hypothetical protein